MNAYYKLEAIHLMGQAKMPISERMSNLLASEIKIVASEDYDNAFSPESELAYRGAMALKHRIGGLQNLETYTNALAA